MNALECKSWLWLMRKLKMAFLTKIVSNIWFYVKEQISEPKQNMQNEHSQMILNFECLTSTSNVYQFLYTFDMSTITSNCLANLSLCRKISISNLRITYLNPIEIRTINIWRALHHTKNKPRNMCELYTIFQ